MWLRAVRSPENFYIPVRMEVSFVSTTSDGMPTPCCASVPLITGGTCFLCLMSDDGSVRNSDINWSELDQDQDSARVLCWLEPGSGLNPLECSRRRKARVINREACTDSYSCCTLSLICTVKTCVRSDLESGLRLGFVYLNRQSSQASVPVKTAQARRTLVHTHI